MNEDGSAWAGYLAAARRLDALQRDAAAGAAAEAGAMAARAELAPLQARLARQEGRLRESAGRVGMATLVLAPEPADRHAAAQSVGSGPVGALAALRNARAEADTADAVLTALDDDRAAGAVSRNLLVYGPISLVTTLIQVVFAMLADDRTRVFYAAVCGLSLAAMGFGLGWLLVRLIVSGSSKTAPLGALTVFTPPVAVMVTLALL